MTATPFVPVPWTSPQAVWSVLVTGPTEEPLTLPEAKLRAGLDWLDGDPRDPMLAEWIQAARAQVEHDTGLALLTQTRDVYFAAPVGSPVPLPSQTQPVQSIALVPAAARATVPLPIADHRPGVRLALVVPAEGATYRVVAGWPTAAALKAEAPSLYHAVALLVAHFATFGRDAVSPTSGVAVVPFGYEEAVAPHRLIWVI